MIKGKIIIQFVISYVNQILEEIRKKKSLEFTCSRDFTPLI